MKIKFEIYSTNQNYYSHKDKLKSVFNSFGLKWNNRRSGWFSHANSVVKQSLSNNDRLLIISGNLDFIEVMKNISDLFFTDKRVEKQESNLEEFIIKRVGEEKVWAKAMGYNVDVVEYFTMRRVIDLNSGILNS